MRKFLISFSLIFCLLFSGFAYAAFNAAAVRTVISRGLTKVCSPIPANDNRCLRLVTSGSDILSGAMTAAGVVYGSPVSWFLLLADYLITGPGGEYLFQLGQDIKLALTKDNQGQVIVVSEETTAAPADVPTVSDPESSTVPVYGASFIQATDAVYSSGDLVYDDPNTTVKNNSGTFFLAYTYYSETFKDFYSVNEARRLMLADFYGSSTYNATGKNNLLLWEKDDPTAQYWYYTQSYVSATDFYFTSDPLEPFWGGTNSPTGGTSGEKRFWGYFATVKYKVQGSADWLTGKVLFWFRRTYNPELCGQDGVYVDSGSCVNLALKIEELIGSEYANNLNPNSYVAEKLSETTIQYLNEPLAEYLAGLENVALSQELPAEFLADAVNKIYRDATSAENYEGLPYDQSKELSAADIQNLAPSMPTVGDARQTIVDTSSSSGVQTGTGLKPDTSTGSLTNPGSGTSTGVTDPIVNTSPNVNAGTIGGTGNSSGTIADGQLDLSVNVNLDLGAYPEAQEPGLEPPEASAILQPIFDLFPALQNYQVPEHSGECYKPEFSMFGKDYVIDVHCTLLDENAVLIQSICSLIWAMCALFVFLKA